MLGIQITLIHLQANKKTADLVLLEDLAARATRREGIFRDSKDMFGEREEWLISCFCLPRHVVLQLCNFLERHLSRQTHCSHSIPPRVQFSPSSVSWLQVHFQGKLQIGLGFHNPV